MNLSKVVLAAAVFFASSAFAAKSAPNVPEYLSYKGSAEITQIKAGKLTTSVRIGDRSKGAHPYKVGEQVALVDSDKREETRSFADQITANAYGHVRFTTVSVTQFSSLSAAEQADFLKYYTQADITKASDVVTALAFTFVP